MNPTILFQRAVDFLDIVLVVNKGWIKNFKREAKSVQTCQGENLQLCELGVPVILLGKDGFGRYGYWWPGFLYFLKRLILGMEV